MDLQTKRWFGLRGSLAVGLGLVMSLAASAWAQDEPAGDPAPAPAGDPAPAPAGDPAPAPPADSAPAPGGDGMAPGGDGMPDDEEDPDVDLEEPKQDDGAAQFGIGGRLRYVFMPSAVLDLFVEFSEPMSSVGFALEVVRRKRDFDIVLGLEYEKVSPEDGYWGEKGETPGNPGEDPDFVEFEDFALLSFDASFIWHKNFNDKVALRYGAGIGAGIVLGKIFQTDTVCSGPTLDTCVIPPTNPREESEDVPPVVPIVNVLFGVRIRPADQISINLETGFRDMFYLGAGTTYFF